MSDELIDLTPENIGREHLCCIIRTRTAHPGVETKRRWLARRLPEGHVFRKLDVKGCAFIEYAPLETAWVPVEGGNYYYIYCLWVQGDLKGHGYELLALSFDGTVPRFAPNAKRQAIESRELTIYYDDQCPYIPQRIEKLREYCQANGIPADFRHVETLEQAKALPCVFNNWAAFYDGKFVTVNQLDGTAVAKLLKE